MDIPWRYQHPLDDEGILVASNAETEWLLPWWWSHYQKTNSRPVAFVDLGLSPSMKTWCKSRGLSLLPCGPAAAVADRDQSNPDYVALWEVAYGPAFWNKRPLFFQKPRACLATPFATTLWVDIDCEIRHNLDEVFAYKRGAAPFCIARDLIVSLPGKPTYNSGVILYPHRHPLIEAWAASCLTLHSQCFGDQDVLSHLLAETGEPFTELPALYQWSHFLGESPLARIVHWHGDSGKKAIAERMGLSS